MPFTAPEQTIAARPRVVGKLVLHAMRDLIAPQILMDEGWATDPFALNTLADVPQPGTKFAPGDPVMTLLASGENVADCQSRLNRLEQEWTARLGFAVC